MFSSIIIFLFFIIILLIVNLLFNLPLYLFLISMTLIILLTLLSLSKKITLFLICSFIYLYFLIIFTMANITILTLVTTVILIIYYINCFKYTFNLYNNAMNIQFETIKIPNSDYLVIKYINGPLDESNVNGIVTKEKDKFVIQIENKENIVKEINVLINDIESINIQEIPYMKSTTNYIDYQIDYMKSYSIGRVKGDFETSKGFKLIPSYEITITLKDKMVINLITFNKPTIFNGY